MIGLDLDVYTVRLYAQDVGILCIFQFLFGVLISANFFSWLSLGLIVSHSVI